MKTFRQYILEILSGINIKDPVVLQQMRDASLRGHPDELLRLYKLHAGKAKPAVWKDPDKYFDDFGSTKKTKHHSTSIIDKVDKKDKNTLIDDSKKHKTH